MGDWPFTEASKRFFAAAQNDPFLQGVVAMVSRRRPWLTIMLLAVVLGALVVGGSGLWLAGEAGRLPWQEDPTRISITPFADIPGFNAPTPTPVPAATP